MKKICNFLLGLALICSLTVTALASQNNLHLRSSDLKEGELVYITVELKQSTVGNGIGVSYTYDEDYLKPVPASCSWVRSGLMQNFSAQGSAGVWAQEQSVDLKGGICVLAFQLVKGLDFTKADVECTLKVKKDTQEVGVYTAKIDLVPDCKHSFGQWSDMGNVGHSRTCKLCGEKNSAPHVWGKPVVTEKSDGTRVETVSCSACGASNSTQTSQKPTETTAPSKPTTTQPTTPSGPQTLKPEPEKESVSPDRLPPADEETQGSAGNNEQETNPTQKHENETVGDSNSQTEPTQHEHNHENTSGKVNVETAIIVVLVLVAMVAALIIYLKKKR